MWCIPLAIESNASFSSGEVKRAVMAYIGTSDHDTEKSTQAS